MVKYSLGASNLEEPWAYEPHKLVMPDDIVIAIENTKQQADTQTK